MIIVITFWNCSDYEEVEHIQLNQMEKIGEIVGNDIENGNTSIWKITSIDIDKNGQIYVADSGNNKVFVFDRNGRYIKTIGKFGQGPGEFMAGTNSNGLRVSVGNNGKVYVYDCSNRRLSVFRTDGTVEITVALLSDGPSIIDTPHVNSKGDIFIVTYYKENIIQIFDHKLKWVKGILGKKYHFTENHIEKAKNPAGYFTGEHQVNVVVTEDDQIYALSNYVMKIYALNQDGDIVMEIDPTKYEAYGNEYRKRMASSRKRGVKFIYCKLLKMPDNKLGIVYYSNGYRKWNIYVFDIETKKLSGIMQIPEMTSYPIQSDHNGHIYCLNENSDRIAIYRIKERP